MLTEANPCSADEVGAFYDRLGGYFATVFGDDNIHFGYWDDADDDAGSGLAQDRLTRMALAWLSPAAEHWVLDVGCGTGGPGRLAVRETGCSVAGVTVSRSQVEQAHRTAVREGVAGRLRVQRADAMALPFPAESFDAVLALESIFHMADRRRAFAEISRVLRPGGRVAITDIVRVGPMTGALGAHIQRTLGCAPLAGVEDYPPALAAAGLRVRELRDISAHSRRSVEQIHERHLSHEGELRAHCGDAFIDALLDDWPAVLAAFGHSLGYVFVTADKPASA
ncbi:methyltransferase domain-containing protein [Nonomuraea zeae]|uniref:Methyltransferase domain-containing protein n=1 Tax=Nonomuraea zeae TaxID=1642303 RepID=A0A5S4GY18_9ACTN|nr:methyltransferase domain-containing protein [Nonomuraea zeae]TMR37873.1 methyltransferase domain-containing protein [Nonomuraea zeae]